MARQRRHFDIEIVDLAEQHVEQTAWIHATCFPDKIEGLLGQRCIEDCLRTRYIQPRGDCHSRVAVLKDGGQVVGYCHAQGFKGAGRSANSFLSGTILLRHLLRRGWFSPRVWAWLLRHAFARLLSPRANEGDQIPGRDDWEVAKMLGVHPDYRGSNIGADLMIDNEREARKRGSTRICGLVKRGNVKAARLYESLGWVYTSADAERYKVFAMHRDLEPAPQAGESPPASSGAPAGHADNASRPMLMRSGL